MVHFRPAIARFIFRCGMLMPLNVAFVVLCAPFRCEIPLHQSSDKGLGVGEEQQRLSSKNLLKQMLRFAKFPALHAFSATGIGLARGCFPSHQQPDVSYARYPSHPCQRLSLLWCGLWFVVGNGRQKDHSGERRQEPSEQFRAALH